MSNEIRDRAAQLLAADMDPVQVAAAVGLTAPALNRLMHTRGFKRALFLAFVAHQSMWEAAQITGHRARGRLPLPLVLDPSWDDEIAAGAGVLEDPDDTESEAG